MAHEMQPAIAGRQPGRVAAMVKSMMPIDESRRIAEVYGDRTRSLPADYYALAHPANLYRTQRRERATLGLLATWGLRDLADLRICEVGCGSGGELLRLVSWGARPENLCGVDLLADRIAGAQAILPAARLEVKDARSTSFADESFDLVMQLTLLSSVLDPDIRLAIAHEMRRILKPGGKILWYDMRVVRPDRPLVALGRAEIARLFPECRLDLRAETLNPVISRITAKASWMFSDMLSYVPLARSHYLGMIIPQARVGPGDQASREP